MRIALKFSFPLFLRCLLGIIFLWAGAVKILHPQDFLVSLYSYEVPLPETLLRLIAILLPWLESITGIALLGGFWMETSLALLTLMSAVFLLATGQAWWRGLEISCGCFGTALEENTFLGSVRFAFWRDCLFLAAFLYLSWGELKKPPESGSISHA